MKSIFIILCWIIGIIGMLIMFVIFAIFITVRLYDRWAIKAARKYCDENGLEYVEAKAFPNHYGLYFRKEGKRFYASFDFEANRTITWKKGSPLEVVENKKKKTKKKKT